MSETFPGDRFNVAAAITAYAYYQKTYQGLFVSSKEVFRVFQAIYNNDDEAARLAVGRIACREPQEMLPVKGVVRELELLLECSGNGKSLLDG